MTPSDSLVSIVLPVHNQADHLEQVVTDMHCQLDRLPIRCELVLVPNGCRDRTVEVCEALARTLSDLRVSALEQGGWGRAVRHGISIARGELICYTNLARTQPKDLVLCILYAVAHPDTVIKANRKVRDGFLRRLGSLIYNLECRMLFDLPYWDINGTPKVFSRQLHRLLGVQREDDLIDLEFNAICREEGYRVLEVPILSGVRHGGRTTTSLESARRMYVGAFRMWRERKR